MFVWGGQGAGLYNSGGIYRPCGGLSAPTAANNGPICVGQTLDLAASFISGATYSWTGPNGFMSSQQNPSIPNATTAASGMYSVTATVSDCTSPAGTTTAIVAPLPTPTITGPNRGCSSPGVALTTQSYETYQWQRSGHDIPGATGQTYTATLSGQYSVRVTSSIGCEGISPKHHVTVVFCPNSEVSPNGCIYALRISKDVGVSMEQNIYFQKIDGANGYNLYIGHIGEWYSHGQGSFGGICNIFAVNLGTGEMRASVNINPGNLYFLVTAYINYLAVEGPSGYSSRGSEIPKLYSTCPP